MTILSLLISLLSLALAGGMAVVVARMRREERDRADARVAALSRMAEEDFLPEPEPFSTATPDASGTSVGLFAEPDAVATRGPRLAIGGALAVALLVVLLVWGLRGPTAAGRDGAGQAATAPLELIALDHRQEGGSLTVSGRVRTSDERPASSLTATVFLFGADGAFMTSGRSPLGVAAPDAGSESTFVVVIPVNGAVARYRVSFRDGAGHPVAHVDRRHGASLARNE